jgi:hypothetical protein
MSAGQVLNSHRQAILEKICSWGRSPAASRSARRATQDQHTISETEIAQGADRDSYRCAPRDPRVIGKGSNVAVLMQRLSIQGSYFVPTWCRNAK